MMLCCRPSNLYSPAPTYVTPPLSLPVSVKKGKGSPHSTAKRRVPELIPDLGSQSAGGVSHKPGVRLPLLSAKTAVILAALKRAAASFLAW